MNSIETSLAVGIAATSISLIPAILVAWFLERTRSRLRTLIHVIIALPMVLPPVVIGYLLLWLFSPRGTLGLLLVSVGLPVAFHWLGAVVAAATVGFPLLVFSVSISMKSIDPGLELASRILGASRMRTFFQITLPLAWPGILAGAVLSFARGIGEFGATIILAGRIPGETETIPLAIYAELEQPGGETRIGIMVLASILICLASVLLARFLDQLHKNRIEREP